MVHRLALLFLLLVEGACQVHDCGQSLQPRGPRAERMQPFELARRRVSNPDLAAGKCKIILKNPLAVCQQLTGRQCCISIGINGVDEGGCACCCSIENAIGLVDARVKIMQHSPCCNKMEPRCKSICDKVGKNMAPSHCREADGVMHVLKITAHAVSRLFSTPIQATKSCRT